MSFDFLTPLLGNGANLILSVIKLGVLALLFVYGVFAFIILIQIRNLGRVVTHIPFSTVLFFLGLIHFVLVAILFIATFLLV